VQETFELAKNNSINKKNIREKQKESLQIHCLFLLVLLHLQLHLIMPMKISKILN